MLAHSWSAKMTCYYELFMENPRDGFKHRLWGPELRHEGASR